MQTTAKATRKVLNQIITVYQSVLEFSLEKVWLEVIIKYNKTDPDAMLDEINARLIDVCDEYLKEHNIWLDKYQLSMIVMDLYTQTISSIDEPFKVIAKESKQIVQEYLEKNKSKREALERIKKENDTLDKEILVRQQEQKEKKVNLLPKPEMPSENSEVEYLGTQAPSPKPKKKVARWTDALAISDFRLPI